MDPAIKFPDEVKGLENYFKIKVVGAEMHFHCLKCKAGYALPNKNSHPGNILKLLDHGHKHKV